MAINKFSEEIKSAQDWLYDGVTVPANTSTDSTAKQVGGAQGALELVFIAKTDIVITDTKVVSLKLQGATTIDGSYTDLVNLYSVTASGETTVTAGTELARYIVKPSDPMFQKAVITTDDTLVVGAVDGYIRQIHR
jgi:hypothetical protein